MGVILPLEPSTRSGQRLLRDATSGLRMPAMGWSRGSRVRVKPAAEWLLVVVTLPFWAPIVALLWLMVKATAPRHPAFFMQQRTGYRGAQYKVYKIRTMVPNAAELEAALRSQNISAGPQFKMRNDPRVTSIGRVLRKLHLDELPQLINVLRGDMGLIGVRPATARLEDHEAWWRARLHGPPGVTGLFQIHRADVHSFEDRARLDIAYVRRCSPWLDLKILLTTPIVAFILRKGI